MTLRQASITDSYKSDICNRSLYLCVITGIAWALVFETVSLQLAGQQRQFRDMGDGAADASATG